MKVFNEVYPGDGKCVGNLIIGVYPHKNPMPDEIILSKERQPYLVIELLEDRYIVRAAQSTKEDARKYYQDNRLNWIVNPVKHE